MPSHWLLDLQFRMSNFESRSQPPSRVRNSKYEIRNTNLVVHVPDLPLYPGGSARFGLGLWRNPVATIVVECVIFFGGLAVYARSTRARDRIGRYALWLLAVFLLALYYASAAGPPPPTVKVLALMALIGWPLTLWPWWVDRHREPIADRSREADPLR